MILENNVKPDALVRPTQAGEADLRAEPPSKEHLGLSACCDLERF